MAHCGRVLGKGVVGGPCRRRASGRLGKRAERQDQTTASRHSGVGVRNVGFVKLRIRSLQMGGGGASGSQGKRSGEIVVRGTCL